MVVSSVFYTTLHTIYTQVSLVLSCHCDWFLGCISWHHARL